MSVFNKIKNAFTLKNISLGLFAAGVSLISSRAGHALKNQIQIEGAEVGDFVVGGSLLVLSTISIMASLRQQQPAMQITHEHGYCTPKRNISQSDPVETYQFLPEDVAPFEGCKPIDFAYGLCVLALNKNNLCPDVDEQEEIINELQEHLRKASLYEINNILMENVKLAQDWGYAKIYYINAIAWLKENAGNQIDMNQRLAILAILNGEPEQVIEDYLQPTLRSPESPLKWIAPQSYEISLHSQTLHEQRQLWSDKRKLRTVEQSPISPATMAQYHPAAQDYQTFDSSTSAAHPISHLRVDIPTTPLLAQ